MGVGADNQPVHCFGFKVWMSIPYVGNTLDGDSGDSGFGAALAHLRTISDGNGNTKGKLFELLVQSFLKTDTVYAERFDEVWMWNDYPGRDCLADPGVDLVGRERKDGSMCAIQCKFYDNSTLTKRDIDSFLEAGSRLEFDSMLLVYTGRGYGKTIQAALAGHNCTVLNFESLAESNIKWPDLAAGLTNVQRGEPYPLRDDQTHAIRNVIAGIGDGGRGQLIMACGTGKTLTSLRLAEEIVGFGGLVLYAVPSISLMRQAIRYWSGQRTIQHGYVGVCSDNTISHGKSDIPIIEMEIGVTTDENRIAAAMRRDDSKMTVIFTTYQSMESVAKAQTISGERFDLVLCDEAHRTTGVERDSPFTIIHNAESILADRRLYMTATPKLYTTSAKTKAANADMVLYSMDDESAESKSVFGPVLHRLSFSDAIDADLLSDYEVVVLCISEEYCANKLLEVSTNEGDINLTDLARMEGLRLVLESPDPENKVRPLQTAIAYTNRVSDSKTFAVNFGHTSEKTGHSFRCNAQSVDGTQNSTERDKAIQWLRDSNIDPDECRVVSNARCLSEGVDVPALDAVAFLNPKSSEIDIIQAVGRVMRRHKGKANGYVIIPLGIPPDTKPEMILGNKKSFGVVWNVLRALRSHDSRLDIEANRVDLTNRLPNRIKFIGIDRNGKRTDSHTGESLLLGDLDVPAGALYSRMVDEVGDRQYLARWAGDVADVVSRMQERIKLVVDGPARDTFDTYMTGLRDIMHDSVSETEGIGMLAQHMVTRRIFNALFGEDDFARSNPMAVSLDNVLDGLRSYGLDSELRDLDGFYESIERRISGLDSPNARQRVISELYGTFFKKAFPKMADRLGIVYTPTEIVDFIMRSVDHVLRENFGKGLTNEGVNVIDPFTGAGTFIARLLSSDLGLIWDEDIGRKYGGEIFANEIVLLAYYIASVNCESIYGQRTGMFEPFEGLSFTDTFNPGNLDEHAGDVMVGPKRRIGRRRTAEITCVVGNPPYSGRQKSANEDNLNVKHPNIEARVKDTYIKAYGSGGDSLYNSYIKALRWASDHIGELGVIGFVMPSAWLSGNAEAGIRACVVDEFTDVWCFDLRGDVLRGDWRKEGGKIFDSGSTVGITITILAKNPKRRECVVHYYGVGDGMTREQKLQAVKDVKSIAGVDWGAPIIPNKYHDWLDQRGEECGWDNMVPIGSDGGKRGKSDRAMFEQYCLGLTTARDGWAYNSSKDVLLDNMGRHIDYCNKQDPDDFQIDPKNAKWNTQLYTALKRLQHTPTLDKSKVRSSMYRPFFKQHLYFDPTFIAAAYKIPKFFPRGDVGNPTILVPDKTKGAFTTIITDRTPDMQNVMNGQAFPLKTKSETVDKVRPAGSSQIPKFPIGHIPNANRTTNVARRGQHSNLAIIVPDKIKGEFSGFITDITPDLEVVHHGQVLPMSVCDGMKDNITDWALNRYQTTYNDYTITKEDIFYYTYGVLHSPGFRKKYRSFLVRGIPNIPYAPDFRAFERAGRELAYLHLNYEICPRYDLGESLHPIPNQPKKIAFGKKPNDGPGPDTIADPTKLLLDGILVYDNIPHTDYKVNGRTPVGWFVDRYGFRIDHKGKSGNTNYPLEGVDGEQVRVIIERLVYVGIESDRIIANLPEEFEMDVVPEPAGLDAFAESEQYVERGG